MLKGIDPLLNGDLLKILDDMGHGDQLLVVDRNYPAHAAGKPLVWLGVDSTVAVASAILSVFPLDTFLDRPLARMEVDEDPTIVTPIQETVLELAQRDHASALEYEVIPRLEFYERAKQVFAVVKTLEDQPYACFILIKGVIFPE
jgi:L-fucose mutarotase